MISMRTVGLLATFVAPSLALAQAPAPVPAPPDAIVAPAQKTIGMPSARKRSEALIVLNAKGATLSGGTLVLSGVAPSAILFASRPVRGAGHMSTADLVALWSTGSFAKDPPNATISAFAKDGSKVTDAVVVLKSARTEATKSGERAIFDIAVLEGDLGNVDGPAAVFIDTVWFSLGNDGFNYIGRSQTTAGNGAPAIGSRSDTSTFSGWSNPAPDARPAYRAPASGGYGYGPPPPDASQAPPPCGKPPLLPCY